VPDDDGFDEFNEKVVELNTRRRFRLIPWEGLKLRRGPNYLVKGLIPRTGLVVVWGPPKCGKSFWTFDLMMHAVLGWTYRNHRVRQGSVIYCAFEGADGFNGRAEAFRRQHQVEIVAPFFLVPATLDLFNDHRELINDIRAQVTEAPAAVVLDTLNRSLVGSESSDEDMAKYVKAADIIRVTFNCVVIIVHHCGIDVSRPRGHTSLTGAADAQLAVKRDEHNNVMVTVEWMKDGPEGEILRSRLELVELGQDDDGDAITSCVVEAVENQDTPRKGKREISPTARVAFRLLADAINDAGSIPSPSPRIPPNTRTIPDNSWREYCYAGTISDSDKPDSKSKAFRRAVAELQAAHMIGIWRDQVWIAGQAGQSRT
jgi:AAA domain